MINLSQAAAEEIKRLQVTRRKSDTYLRLGVKVGGCSGLSYTLDFDEAIQEGDRLYESRGISVIIDSQSASYLHGLNLDYSADLMGGAFRFSNPNASESCGCGHSFSVNQ
ncbi:MAG: HesB/IscA family protein [Chroococcales cyanobacterium]